MSFTNHVRCPQLSFGTQLKFEKNIPCLTWIKSQIGWRHSVKCLLPSIYACIMTQKTCVARHVCDFHFIVTFCDLTLTLTFLTLVSVGRLVHSMSFFFWNGWRTTGWITLKFCIGYRPSFAQFFAKKFWPGHVRLHNYDVIRGTPSGRFFKEIVFSTT